MKAQNKLTYNGITIIAVEGKIRNFSKKNPDLKLIVDDLLNNLASLNPKKNSLVDYYKKSGLDSSNFESLKNSYENVNDLLLNIREQLNEKGVTETPSAIILSYFVNYKYLHLFKDVWYNSPFSSLRLSDDYVEFLRTIPIIRENDFISDSTVLENNFGANIIYPFEELLLGDKSEKLDMYLVQLDRKVCLEISRNRCESPDLLKIENDFFFNLLDEAVNKDISILIAYF